ncbi:hypothetical protein SAMN02745671_01149 [Anaerovibrio lipolyticus DSM 3074]|uniref:Uncharacterized protein n=1 Tax=Anaerovibrio lipolyticus DSM 3074 TaxID=1120997 RepID=A0A1M6CK07_9FIRM|nr:hypothetical protein [Anaerovibrio lipolyticus]SHI61336.1 hypothetical protein SAMN02745671_01149 [Anaerovibrio lipolyticus DSM 3074]
MSMMNPQQIIQQMMTFRNQMLQQNPNANPQQMVNQLLQSGKINQQQFERARGMLGMFGFKL